MEPSKGVTVPAVHQEQGVAGHPQQVAVVGDQDQGPLVALQGLRQGLTHVQVQVIGGLVQQQQVGAPADQQGQGQPRLLAPGQRRHRLHGAIPDEGEAPQVVAQFLLGGVGLQALEVAQRAVVRAQLVHLVLGEVAGAQVLGPLAPPGEQRQGPGQDLDEGGLARPVRAQEPDAVARVPG